MLDGIYRSIDSNEGYDITIRVRERDKSYVFQLVKNSSRFNMGHFEMMFRKSDKITIKKKKCPHAIRDWEDGTFTIYPYRMGFPYLFEKIG